MLGDNFMWDPREGADKVIVGETSDSYFHTMGAFEIVAFGFGMSPGGETIVKAEEGGESGGAGGGPGQKSPFMNAGLAGGVKLGGSVVKKSGGGGGGLSGGIGGGTGSGGSSGSGSKGKPKFGTLTINKFVDNASTALYQYCSTGEPIPTLNMAVRKSGGDPLLYLQYCFRYNQITGISWEGGSGDTRAKETFTMEFKAMGMQYIAQTPSGGYHGNPKEWRWSVETGDGQNTLDINGEPPDEPIYLAGIVE